MKQTLVVPCYNEAENVVSFYRRVEEVFAGELPQVVFVDDGSTDETLSRLKALFEEANGVKVVSLSRNFGKEAAILAGLRASDGDLLCVIDVDLQQDPSVAREMFEILRSEPETDAVAAYQDGRKEKIFHRLCKVGFYSLANALCEVSYRRDASDFRAMRRNVAEAVLTMPEKERFSKGLFGWVGFHVKYIPYTVQKRLHGKSKWRFSTLSRYALDGIFSFSRKPLRFSLAFSLVCFLGAVAALILDAVFAAPLVLAVLLPVILFLFSLLFFVLWILGEYLGKAALEAKDRPAYFVREVYSRPEDR